MHINKHTHTHTHTHIHTSPWQAEAEATILKGCELFKSSRWGRNRVAIILKLTGGLTLYTSLPLNGRYRLPTAGGTSAGGTGEDDVHT